MTLEDQYRFNRSMLVLGELISRQRKLELTKINVKWTHSIADLVTQDYIRVVNQIGSDCCAVSVNDKGVTDYNDWHLNLISTLRLLPTNGVSEQDEKKHNALSTPPASASTAWNVERLLGA